MKHPTKLSTRSLLKTDVLPDPVVGLRKLPTGPRYTFDDYSAEDRAKRTLVIGSAPTCDIHLRDEQVSSNHCLIERDGSRVIVHDCSSKNGTRINGIPIKVCDLVEGSLLTVGRITLIAYGEKGTRDGILLAAATLDEFIRNAVEAYGTIHKAATGIGVPYSTLQGWLKNGRFARRLPRRSTRRSDGAAQAQASPPSPAAPDHPRFRPAAGPDSGTEGPGRPPRENPLPARAEPSPDPVSKAVSAGRESSDAGTADREPGAPESSKEASIAEPSERS